MQIGEASDPTHQDRHDLSGVQHLSEMQELRNAEQQCHEGMDNPKPLLKVCSKEQRKPALLDNSRKPKQRHVADKDCLLTGRMYRSFFALGDYCMTI